LHIVNTAAYFGLGEPAMTTQVLFVQGGGEDVHDKWDNTLVDNLERALGPDYDVRYPRMPDEADPTYAAWAAALKQQFDRLDDGAILVGHSIGGTILIRTLADEPPSRTFAGIFLIAAPFVGDGGWQSEDIEPVSDLGARLSEETPLHLYHGTKDETAPFEHVHLYARVIPHAVVCRLAGRDHQLNNDVSEVAADIRRLVRARSSTV
jgi:predicted alpha/beta hydrolase family esterase